MSNHDDVHETPSTTPNLKTELARQLQELVPEAIADGKVDIVKLKELLGDDAGSDTERFGLFWPGKKAALRAAQEPTTATLRPDRENSKDWDTTQNVFIEGDNLEVLKILQKHYHGKIKMIYIDPPYNTGKDFVYPDNYKEGLATYLEWTKQVNEEGKKVSTNPESEGRYHSNWLNMMYPRLKLARNLLTDDGVMFVSIDDHEVAHLRKVCDEIFGEDNFEGHIHWRRRHNQPNDPTKMLALVTEHILVYARAKSKLKVAGVGKIALTGEFSNPDSDPRGGWASKPWKVGAGQSGTRYVITTPTGRIYDEQWMGERTTYEALLRDNRIIFPSNGNGPPRKKYFRSEREQEGQCATNWWPSTQFGHNQGATSTIELLFGEKHIFDNPKPIELLDGILSVANVKHSDLVLDFFSGSATTAHAVIQLNANDGGNRRYIQVQLPEPTPKDSDAHRAGFSTISEIARKRIELAGKKINEDLGSQLISRDTPLDIGYRTYKLVDTNFAKWRLSSGVDEEQLQQRLLGLRDSTEDAASADDLLTEILLKQGYSLSERISEIEIDGLPIQSVGDGLLLAYLDERTKPTLEQLRAVVDVGPGKFIIPDDVFQSDDELKTNLAQLCKSKGIELWTA